ncbi:DUF5676 family membrane protein [Maricaulis sp.]|uniref:DUF5676 family membrane protein n=1 Tax=Maricaulis sp. TaxID=1486257 RepID=UPI003A92E503
MSEQPSRQGPRVVPLGLTLSSFLLVTYLLCIIFGLIAPGQFHMHEAWAPLLPGFEWLTPQGVLFGAIGSFLYGWYTAVLFVPLYRLFHR